MPIYGSLAQSYFNSPQYLGDGSSSLATSFMETPEWQNFINTPEWQKLIGQGVEDVYLGNQVRGVAPDSLSKETLSSAGNVPPASQGGGIDSRSGDNMITQMGMGISQIVNAKISWDAHDRYARLLETLQLDLPSAIIQAETGYRELARRGLPGIEQYKQDVLNLFAQSMTEADKTGNINTRMSQLSSSQKMVTDALSSLNLQDMSQQMRNQLTLLKFLDTVKAPYQQNILEFDIQKKLAAEQERMIGGQEAMQGATNATYDISNSINSIISMAAGGMG